MFAIIVMLVVLGSLKETVADIKKELVTVCNVAFHSLIAQLTRRVCTERGRVTTIHHAKWCILQSCVVGCIVAVLHPR
jgi:hypothetical protein